MPVAAHHQTDTIARDADIARASVRQLALAARANRPLTLRTADKQDDVIELPAGAVALLADILENIAAGRSMILVAQDAEIGTFEAAQVLAVSRPYLIKLLEAGEIPQRKVGSHRRIRMEDVLAFKARDDRRREAILDELAADAQADSLGY